MAVASSLGELVTRASWLIRRGTRRELEAFGITWGQARALRTLADAPGPLRMADLAGRLDVVPRAATSTADALEAAGLVARHPDTGDRRSVRVALTGEGAGLVDRMRAARLAEAEELFARLDRGEQAELARLLELVLDDTRGELRAEGSRR